MFKIEVQLAFFGAAYDNSDGDGRSHFASHSHLFRQADREIGCFSRAGTHELKRGSE